MLIFISTVLLAILFVLATLRAAPSLGLIAEVSEHRQHELPTPLIGGLAMFCAVLLILVTLPMISEKVDAKLLYHYLAGASLLVIVGILDDRFHLPFILRLIVQVIAVLIMVRHGNILNSLGELFSTDTLLLGSFSIPLTIFATVGVINALNMADGIDGLAGSLCFLSFVILLAFPFHTTYLAIIYAWLGALVGFLLFNLRMKQPARIFMGDAGSTLLGYTLAWLLIYGSQQEIDTVALPRYFPPIFAVWLLALPLFETVSLMLLRAFESKSPFHADRGHMHHHLLIKVQSVNVTLMILLIWFSAYALVGYVFNTLNVAVHIQTLFFAVCFILHLLLQAYLRRKNPV